MENRHPRGKDGKYVHEWGVIGDQGIGPREVAECQLCGAVWSYGDGTEHRYKHREAARKAGETFYEGY